MLKVSEREAQTRMLLRWMEAGFSITGIQAVSLFRCMRLSARVADLKSAGVPVQFDWEYEYDQNGKVVRKWKKYFIAKQ